MENSLLNNFRVPVFSLFFLAFLILCDLARASDSYGILMVLASSGGNLAWTGANVVGSDVYAPVRGPVRAGNLVWYRVVPDSLDAGSVSGWGWVRQSGGVPVTVNDLDPGAVQGGIEGDLGQDGQDEQGDGGPQCPGGCVAAGAVLSRYGAADLALVAPEPSGFRVVVVSGGQVTDWTDMPDLSGLEDFLAGVPSGTGGQEGNSGDGVFDGGGSVGGPVPLQPGGVPGQGVSEGN